MWVLESLGKSFGGRKLWLRPGKQYLLGRTSGNPGELAISHKTVSRKHLLISVAEVEEGGAQNLSSRSKLTVEDLNSSKGSVLDGSPLKGVREISVLRCEFKMGANPEIFKITWIPIVLVYSFSSKSASQADPFHRLRLNLEPLDIKFLTDYRPSATHVVAKKRNTPKGLQALINGKFLVSNSFVDAIVAAAKTPAPLADGVIPLCPLEEDYDAAWPAAVDYVPPKGNEAIDRGSEAFLPDGERQDVFKGYTFVFYDEAQYNNLMGPITNGKGKTLLYSMEPHVTKTKDFLRFVKEAANDPTPGEFSDGSTGPGVVIVRYIPPRGPDIPWYSDFITSVSLSLNHRAIEQSEFIEAILTVNPSMLRRPLPVSDAPQRTEPASTRLSDGRNTQIEGEQGTTLVSRPASNESSQMTLHTARPRGRKPATRRFKGFDSDEDEDDGAVTAPSQWQSGMGGASQGVGSVVESTTQRGQTQAQMQAAAAAAAAAAAQALVTAPGEDSDDGLFVQEGPDVSISQQHPARRSERKRPLQHLMDDSLMDDIAPTAAKVKRRRILAGEPAIKPDPELEPEEEEQEEEEEEEDMHVDDASQEPIAPPRKIKKEIDILEVARKTRQEEEARLCREQEDLAYLPEDLDMLEIRRGQVIEEMPLRRRQRDEHVDMESRGSWDSRWNGRRNFKKFRKRGKKAGRAPGRTVVPLAEARVLNRGDDYWLEEELVRRETAPEVIVDSNPAPPTTRRLGRTESRRTILDSDSDEDDLAAVRDVAVPAVVRSQMTRGSQAVAETLMGSAVSVASSRGRGAGSLAVGGLGQRRVSQKRGQEETQREVEPPAKRTRGGRQTITIEDSDSEEETRFKFGRRR